MSALSSKISPTELSSKNIDLVIIGCGDPSLIKAYAKDTGAKYPIYADPAQSLFKAFGLGRTLQLGKKPEYMSFGVTGGIIKGVSNGIKAGLGAFKAGDMKQIGGEYSPSREFVNVDFYLDRGRHVCGDIGWLLRGIILRLLTCGRC